MKLLYSNFLKNNSGHMNLPSILVQVITILTGATMTVLLFTGSRITSFWVLLFAIIFLFSQGIHLLFGMNPIGMMLSLIIIITSVFLLKSVIISPSSGFSALFMANAIIFIPVFTILDIIRELVD